MIINLQQAADFKDRALGHVFIFTWPYIFSFYDIFSLFYYYSTFFLSSDILVQLKIDFNPEPWYPTSDMEQALFTIVETASHKNIVQRPAHRKKELTMLLQK